MGRRGEYRKRRKMGRRQRRKGRKSRRNCRKQKEMKGVAKGELDVMIGQTGCR